MEIKDMTKEDLQVLSYTDLTYMILKENKKTMNTPTIFQLISDIFEYTEDEFASKIGDYYTSLTLDKRFVLLDNAEWDLREKRPVAVTYEDDEDEEEDSLEDDEDEEEIEEDDDVDAINEDDDLEDDDDTLGLNIVEDDEEEEEM